MKIRHFVVTSVVSASLVLSGCAGQDKGEVITIGEFTSISALDPAAVYGTANFEVLYQIYPTLLNSEAGSTELKPDIAVSAEFTEPDLYTVKLKDGLRFANGNALTASDAAFSINRQLGIADEFGPSILLANLDRAEAVDELTVNFHLKLANDQTFPYVLSSVPGLIIDEETFSADRVMTNEEVLASEPYAGPYVIESFKLNEFISYKPNPNYQGLWGQPKNSGILVKYYTDAKNLAFDAQNGNLDIAITYRSLSGEEISSISESAGLRIDTGDASEPGYFVFNLNTMPFGAEAENADPVRALAVRKAFSFLLDRESISQQVYAGTYLPSYSAIPSAVLGHDPTFIEQLTATTQAEREVNAFEVLSEAGITEPVELKIVFPIDRYGPATESAMSQVKDQLEASGLFALEISAAEWSAFREIRRSNDWQSLMLFWGPDFGDADNYISPLFKTDGFLSNHYSNSSVDSLIESQMVETDQAKRAETLRQIQELLAQDLPVVPFLETGRSALVKPDILGVSDTLDASHKLRYVNFYRD